MGNGKWEMGGKWVDKLENEKFPIPIQWKFFGFMGMDGT